MNWSKCKTIFIVCFLIIDFVLFSTLLYTNFKDCYLPKSDLNAIETYMASQNISAEDGVIPRWVFRMKNKELTNVLSNESPLITQFFENKEDAKVQNKTYETDDKTLTIEHNQFVYIDKSAFKNQTLSESSIVSLTLKKLKALGFSMSGVRSGDVTYQNNTYQFTFSKTLSKKSLEPASLSISILQSGKMTVSGMWFNSSSHERYLSFTPRSVRDVLVSFCQDMKSAHAGKVTIRDISLCYRIDSTDTYHKTFTASGAYKITTQDGAVYYYNVRE